MGLFRAKAALVCYTAVFSVVPKRSSPQTAAENRTRLYLRTEPQAAPQPTHDRQPHSLNTPSDDTAPA